MNGRVVLRLPSAAALLLGLCACTTSRYYDVQFAPAPLEMQITTQANPQSQARALLSVRGIARATDTEPARAEMRLRIDNLGPTPLTVLPESFNLVTADLESFAPAQFVGPVAPRVEGSSSSTFDIHFLVPPGKSIDHFNLRGLNLGWSVDFDGTKITTGATFSRVEWPYYYDGYPDVHVGFGVGYVGH